MSAASQAKRRRPDAEVIALERGPYVSYGACGMPYNIADASRNVEDLIAVTEEELRTKRGIDLRTRTEATAVDTGEKLVTVREQQCGRTYELPYDKLIIATGALAVRPLLKGLDLPGVFVLRELTDGSAIKRFIAEKNPRTAVIIGASYVGLEMAEALRARDLSVVVLERESQVLPGYEPEIAERAAAELARHQVQVHTRVLAAAIEPGPEPDSLMVMAGQSAFTADLVLLAVGIRPNVGLAREAGIRLGETGAIAVDAGMRTNVDDVYAAGDCAEAFHLVSGKPAYIPLGTTANKQGRIAGANAAGEVRKFRGIVGTAGFKLFDLEVARTGLSSVDAARLDRQIVVSYSHQDDFARSFSKPSLITTALLVEPETRLVLGAQMIGKGTVAKRIDIIATALFSKMTVDELEGLDLSYAPPFAPVYDPVIIAATVGIKSLEKRSSSRP
jgi:CoA-dependent NAD(P)H sulfur oxidoreductase